MAALVTPSVPIVDLSPSSSFFFRLAKVASVEPQVPSLCRTVVFPRRIIADLEGLNLNGMCRVETSMKVDCED
jgi:hypothetical protein